MAERGGEVLELALERREAAGNRRRPVWPGATSPKSTVSDGVSCWLPTCVPMIWKLSARPFSFWTICGWAVVIERLLAVPAPTLVTSNPSDGGLARHDDLRRGGVFADHGLLQEIIELEIGLRIDGDRGREDRRSTTSPPEGSTNSIVPPMW